MEIKDIKEIVELINHSSIDHFEYEKDGARIILKKSSASFLDMTRSIDSAPIIRSGYSSQVYHEDTAKPSEPVQTGIPETTVECTKQILSPMVGTFYAAPSPDKEHFVKIGDRINEQSIVCIIEAMKLFNEIEAEVSGEIIEIHVKNGQLVEFGQPLFSVK